VSWHQVDPDELQGLIDKAARIEKSITDRLAEIDKRIGDVHLGWDGEAGSGEADRIYTGVVDHHKGMWPQT